jgi:hypothetical protein
MQRSILLENRKVAIPRIIVGAGVIFQWKSMWNWRIGDIWVELVLRVLVSLYQAVLSGLISARWVSNLYV